MEPNVALASAGALFIRHMHFQKAGDREFEHSHNFDHMTLLVKGSLDVKAKGKTTRFVAGPAGQIIYIKADTLHELTALEDDTVACCIHALRDKRNPENLLDASMIPEGVDAERFAAPLIKDRV